VHKADVELEECETCDCMVPVGENCPCCDSALFDADELGWDPETDIEERP